MNIINRTALSNFRKNKSRNLLTGAAIALTSLLLTVTPTIIVGVINLQNQAVMEIYPTYHAMFRDVDSETIQELTADERIEDLGLREDPALVYCDDSEVHITMISVDSAAVRLARQELAEGRFPEKADEIVVSEGILEAMGLKGTIGDRIELPFRLAIKDGEMLQDSREFTIVGMTEDNEISKNEGNYTAFVSETFGGEIIPEGEREYRVYLRINDAEGMVTDSIKEQIEELGGEYGIEKRDILMNQQYLMAAYVDPNTYKILALIMFLIAIVGILTIYSIYYVSMLDKVQEYGKLRAIGATKRQIRKLVFREGLAVAAIAIPAGLILGSFIGVLVIRGMMIGVDDGEVMYNQMRQIMDRHEVHLIRPWMISCSILISLATVYVSLLRPMRTASKIPAIEAVRYQGEDKSGKKSRKGYTEMNTRRLTITNLKRNKRRTAITIFALGATGSLFLIVATICACMNPKVMARQELRRDIRISVDAYGDDEVFPEHSLRNIQQNNPLTEDFREQILQIDGVEDVDVDLAVTAWLEDVMEEEGKPYQTGITGLSAAALEELEAYVTAGSLHDPALMDGRGLIFGSRLRSVFPEMRDWDVGTTVRMKIADGQKELRKEFRIVALVDGPTSIGGTYVSMPADVLQSLCETDLTDVFEITVEDGKEDMAAEAIQALIDHQEFLEMKTYKAVYQEEARGVRIIMYGCYGLLLIFGLIGILNLVNTMINSIYVRRKELGMLQAIGMSGRQTINMLQMEGLFYTAGTLAVSLGLGSLLGYEAFLWAKKEGIMSITTYQYPLLPAVVLSAVVLVVQILITYLVNYNFKKQSLIDRIRFAE